MGAALTFLLAHLDLIELIAEAIKAGVSKDTLKDKIKAEMTLASDALIAAEFGGK